MDIKFNVIITTSEPITTEGEKTEMVINILNALEAQVHELGLTPMDSSSWAEKIEVQCGTITKIIKII